MSNRISYIFVPGGLNGYCITAYPCYYALSIPEKYNLTELWQDSPEMDKEAFPAMELEGLPEEILLKLSDPCL